MKNIKALKAFIALLFAIVLVNISSNVIYAKPLDEIVDYQITADVLDDSSVELTYDISWKVLDSKSEGPLSWVRVGIPNKNCNYTLGITDNISSISTDYSGGSYVRIDFDRDYYADEIVHFIYRINMDNMYYYDPEAGYAEYAFTAAWFDDIAVDNLTIRWNSDKVDMFSPSCIMEGGYNVWNTSLKPGEKFQITVRYPGDAYAFTVFEQEKDNSYEYSEHSVIENIGYTIFLILFIVIIAAICFAPMAIPVLAIYGIYKAATGFTTGSEKKITRTMIEYYPSCPNCGGTRDEGKDTCAYCDTNMIKSKQTVTEEQAKKDQDISKYTSNGTYRYASDPNRYVRVNVISVPHVVSRPSSGSRSSHHSSCAHSSCACACACACAGGGRAGCSTKDFYNTDFKLKYLKRFKKKDR